MKSQIRQPGPVFRMNRVQIPKVAPGSTPSGEKEARLKHTWRPTVTAELKKMDLTWGEEDRS